MTLSADDIAGRLSEIQGRIARAAERARRDPAEVRLVAVTKTHSAETVRTAAKIGIGVFGENRVAEGVEKIQALRAEFPNLEWRLIGPLQTNKAKPALQWFSVIESLDRERLARRLEGLLAAENRTFPVLLEVNLGGEETKSGAAPGEVEALAASVLDCPHLDVRGLMAVPPFAIASFALARPASPCCRKASMSAGKAPLEAVGRSMMPALVKAPMLCWLFRS